MGGLIAVFVFVAVLVAVFIAMYNGLVRLRQQTMNAWAQIDVQLKRRYDLIPNLVETVKGYMAHEQGTLEKVIQARNMAMNATGVSEKGKAEGALAGALTGIFGLAEAYPDLKANSNMIQLQEELRETESKISFSRQYYNDVVTEYNTKLETFPSSIVAGIGSFQARELFELTEPAEREPVKVKF
ncbi:MAG: LemA family protein [Fimbriimonadaceae bacterium]|nr:LemA family protein [Fimbriimonadaceae bacterium]